MCNRFIKNVNTFIKEARAIHGDKYDYSKVVYNGANNKVCIICPKHGEFWQTPHSHLQGSGCKKCSNEKQSIKKTYTIGQFLAEARKVHGDKYDYSKIKYYDSQTKVCIICPIHGEFWQTPAKHLMGQGCSNCQSSHLENEIRIFLTEKNIQFEGQKKFDWLGRQSLDFYLPKYNIAIECQGEQHFKPINYFGGEERLKKITTRDERKRKLCEEHGVKLLYYSNLGIEYPYKVYEDKEELIENIKKC